MFGRGILQADQEARVRADCPHNDEPHPQPAVVVPPQLRGVLGGAAGVERAIGAVIAQRERVRIWADVEFLEDGSIPLESALLRHDRRCTGRLFRFGAQSTTSTDVDLGLWRVSGVYGVLHLAVA